MTHREIADRYNEWLLSWASPKTAKTRTTLAANRLKEWGLSGLTSENIQPWINGQDSPWSRTTYYSHLRDLCAWLIAEGYIDNDPMDGVRKPRRPKPVPRPLSEAEVSLVLSRARPPELDWIRLALLTGLRAHEIAKLHGRDVTETHIYVEGKGGVRAALPTHPDIWKMAQRYPRDAHWFPGRDRTTPILGNTISLRVGRLFRELGITGSVHRCRHTYGTRLLRSGTNIRTVQQLMRHASLATTEVYTQVTDTDMRDAIGRLSA